VRFYGDFVKMCEDFSPNFGDERTGCCIMITHRHALLLSLGIFFTKNNMAVVHHPPYFSLFSQLKITPSQNRTSRMYLKKNCRSAGYGACELMVTYSKVMLVSRRKVGFDQMGAPPPEVMDGSL
jgi:hypothetical protein